MSSQDTTSLLGPLKRPEVIITTILFALSYLILQAYLLNLSLVISTLSGSFPLGYKLTLLFQLISGYFAMFPLAQSVFTISAALLVGLNLVLVIALSLEVIDQKAQSEFPVVQAFWHLRVQAVQAADLHFFHFWEQVQGL